MVCLQPLLLWGLAGIGIPLAIHLLSRHHTPVMHWAAMQLLRQAVTTRSRRIKLEDVFLLLLRCLAIACLAVALARPVLPTWQSSAKAMSGSAPGTVIALDCSYSMGYHAGVSARFDRGVKLVRDVLQNAPAGMRLTVLLLGRRPRLLYKSLNSNPAEVSALLGKTEILPEPLALESNLEAVQAALQDMDVPERECYLVTDAQRLDWGDLSRAARTCLNSIAGLARVFLLPCGDEGQENLAVTELRPLSGHLIKGEMVRLLAEVWNSGSQTQNNVKVRLALEDTVVDEKTVTVGPQQTVPVFLYARLKQSGPVRALASISEDALALDNTRCAILHVRDTLKILCVDGSLGLSGFAPDSRYLVVAFSPGKVKSASARGLEVERVSRPQFDNVRLFDYQAVALVNVPELPPSALNALRDYVLWGGGLLVFAGELQSAELLNRSFGKAGLLPGELSAPVGNAVKQDSALALEVLSGDAAWGGAGGGALAQNLRALPKEMLSEALFYRRFPVKLAPGAREILRFENNGGVLLAEQDVGRGKVLFFNCTADEQWTNLPKTTLFPILLHQAVTELTQQESERAFTVGE
ncbi:MAG: BatA domain-containing protein, partial [Planctomycetota bacterium]